MAGLRLKKAVPGKLVHGRFVPLTRNPLRPQSLKKLARLERELHNANVSDILSFHPKHKKANEKRITRLQREIAALKAKNPKKRKR